MRLWSIHPKYLDRQGLTALWRESLLAQAVLRGETKGYRNHPQLERFKNAPAPLACIGAFLAGIRNEATSRGYSFDASKIAVLRECAPIAVTSGQVEHEWRHLLLKLATRTPQLHAKWRSVSSPECHPIFTVHPGPVEHWERVSADA